MSEKPNDTDKLLSLYLAVSGGGENQNIFHALSKLGFTYPETQATTTGVDVFGKPGRRQTIPVLDFSRLASLSFTELVKLSGIGRLGANHIFTAVRQVKEDLRIK